MLTQTRLQQALRYDPLTGVFTWRVKCGRAAAGNVAGHTDPDGYVSIRFAGVLYAAQRLAWLYMRGEWPEHEVDHRNGRHSDNRWDNLRDVPHAVNMQNVRVAHVDSGSGVLGIARGGRGWRARICIDGKIRNLGVFDTPEDAHAAYIAAKRKLHAGCTV